MSILLILISIILFHLFLILGLWLISSGLFKNQPLLCFLGIFFTGILLGMIWWLLQKESIKDYKNCFVCDLKQKPNDFNLCCQKCGSCCQCPQKKLSSEQLELRKLRKEQLEKEMIKIVCEVKKTLLNPWVVLGLFFSGFWLFTILYYYVIEKPSCEICQYNKKVSAETERKEMAELEAEMNQAEKKIVQLTSRREKENEKTTVKKTQVWKQQSLSQSWEVHQKEIEKRFGRVATIAEYLKWEKTKKENKNS